MRSFHLYPVAPWTNVCRVINGTYLVIDILLVSIQCQRIHKTGLVDTTLIANDELVGAVVGESDVIVLNIIIWQRFPAQDGIGMLLVHGSQTVGVRHHNLGAQ